MNNYIVGIDPGLNGGIVVLDKNHIIVDKTIMPVLGTNKKEYDILSIKKFLYKYAEDIGLVILERSQPQFRDGKKQAFKTGFGYGVLQASLVGLDISYQIIAPKGWQKVVFDGLNTDDTKLASALFCQQKWPKEDWRRSERAKNMHDGMTDAACLAYYGVIKSA